MNGFDSSFVRHQDYEFLVRFFESYLLEAIPEILVIKNNENVAKFINLLLSDHSLMLNISAQNIELSKKYTVEDNLNQILKVISENIH